MGVLFILLLFGLIIICGLLIIVQASSFRSSAMSLFELKRRATNGDPAAQQAVLREQWLPKARILRMILLVLLSIIGVSLAVYGGFVVWLVVAMIVITSPIIGQISFVKRISTQLGKRFELYVIKASDFMWPLTRQWPHKIATTVRIHSEEEMMHLIHTTTAINDQRKQRLVSYQNLLDASIGDYIIPLSKLATLHEEDLLGPMLLDTLHKSNQTVFPVMKDNYTSGFVRAERIMSVQYKKSPLAREVMENAVYYIGHSQPVMTFLQLAAKTNSQACMTVDSNGRTTGMVQLRSILSLLTPVSEIDLRQFETPHPTNS